MAASTSSVRVAVRVRPLTESEQQHHCKNNITFVPNQPQLNVGQDRSFTFDYTYTPLTGQQKVFDTCVIPLVNKYMDGYNSTILAYGQTGSGKTFSMGIGLDSALNPLNDGIVPLFINTLFGRLEQKQDTQGTHHSEVSVSFLELYNEEIVDLLCATRKENPSNLSIREDHHGNIHWSGVREEKVHNAKDLFEYLKKGSVARTTASTDMNHTSSRSHAIFSVVLKQTLYCTDDPLPPSNSSKKSTLPSHESLTLGSPTSSTNSSDPVPDAAPMVTRTLVSKFHFVDLAGSERLKRTNAVGDRAKEGISINSGLLALGNVISALGDESRKSAHVPYRDSKLTRLLQDSLGGNSQTLMLACISPADINHTETLNTLKYANRARNIRNRVMINQELSGGGGNNGGGGGGESEQRLKGTIRRLKNEIRTNEDFVRAVNDEMDGLKVTVQQLQSANSSMATELAQVKCERDLLQARIRQHSGGGGDSDVDALMQQLTDEYTKTIEQLRAQLQQQQQQQQGSLNNGSAPEEASSVDQGPPKAISPNQGKPTDTKKKRHSHRIGSLRRSLKGRHRTSNGSVSSKSTLRPDSLTAVCNAKQVKTDIRQENQFIQVVQASLDSLALKTPVDEPGTDIFSAHDGSTDQAGREKASSPSSLSTTTATLCLQLIQRFQQSVSGKSELLQHLDQVEKQRKDTIQQLEHKLSDEKQKTAQLQAQQRQKMNELVEQYEQKQRKQLTELQTLRRKHTQLVNSSATSRTQQENAIRNLKTSLEDAKHDKKKTIKRMKQETSRTREKCQEYEQLIEEGRRLEKQAAQTKKKLERDLSQAWSSNKKLGEENQALQLQLKHMSPLAPRKLLATNGQQEQGGASRLNGTGSLLPTPPTSTLHQRPFHHNKRPKKKDNAKLISLQQNVIERKQLILRAITAHANSQVPSGKISELREKRDRLIQEQDELLKERDLVIQDQTGDTTALDATSPQYMDERIDAITSEIDLLNYCIEQLEAAFPNTTTTTTNAGGNKIDDDWVDVVDQDTHLDATTTTKSGHAIALSLVRTLEQDEPRLVCEALVNDLVQLKQEQHTNHLLTGHLTTTLVRHQEALVRMRKGNDMDTSFQHAFHDPIRMWNGLVLLASMCP